MVARDCGCPDRGKDKPLPVRLPVMEDGVGAHPCGCPNRGKDEPLPLRLPGSGYGRTITRTVARDCGCPDRGKDEPLPVRLPEWWLTVVVVTPTIGHKTVGFHARRLWGLPTSPNVHAVGIL